MQPSSPLLTFAIPTYNRARSLERLLAILRTELEGEDRVELLVSDNASSDGTPDVVQSFPGSIRYIRNPENLGADRNIQQCVESASGKYVWVFSDDDIVVPGTFRRVLAVLATQAYDIVCITPFFSRNEEIRHRRFRPVPDIEFATARELACHFHVLFTFISSVIIDKERLSTIPHPPFASLLDTSLGHLGPFFTALNGHRKSLVIRDPLVTATANRSVGYELYRVFGPNLAKITSEWIKDESVRKAIINGTIQKFLPPWIMLSRKSLASTIPEDPHQILRTCFGKYSRYWIFNYPIYALPLPLANLWLLVIRIINKFDTLLLSAI